MLEEGGHNYEELYKTWVSFSTNIGGGLEKFMKEYEGDYITLHDDWVEKARKINERFAKVMTEAGTDYEDLYKKLFERTATLQRSMGMYPFMTSQTTPKEIGELKSRINELEKRIETLSTKA